MYIIFNINIIHIIYNHIYMIYYLIFQKAAPKTAHTRFARPWMVISFTGAPKSPAEENSIRSRDFCDGKTMENHGKMLT